MLGAPRLWRRADGRLAEIATAFLRVQAGAGAAAVQLFDSWAGGLSPGRLPRARAAAHRAG